MKASILTAYHRQAPLFRSRTITPIHVGREIAPAALPDMQGDDSGRNISSRNPSFCELTALYWAWQNDTESDMIGLMHYRRLLDLTDRLPGGAVERTPDHLDTRQWTAEAESWIAQQAANWDIVLPRLHEMGLTVEENYAKRHWAQDFDLARDIIARDHPDYADSFEAVARDRYIRLGNMALMSRPVFDRYCAWLFDILFKVEAAPVSRTHYSTTQMRYLGFLAERLFTVFVHHEQESNPTLRLREVSILNLADTLVTPFLLPEQKGDPGSVNIAFSSDRAYLPHAAAMLRSLVDHASSDRPLDLFYLHDGIPARDLGLLETVISDHPHATLHPINTHGAFKDSYRSASRAPSNATYNRFLLFDLLPGLDRLLYLDVDVILREDICKLYDTDIGNARIAAVTDWIMTRTLSGPVKTIDPDVPDLRAYHFDVLGLSETNIARYFNAGVLLFNFAAMEDVGAEGKALVAEAREGGYLFRDQDILNRHFKDSLFSLDPRWNVFNSDPAAYGRVPADGHAQAMAARTDPWLIHYADRDYKPWRHAAVPMAQYYWQALIRTPFYGEVLRGPRAQTPARNTSPVVRAGRALAERVPILKRPLLWIYGRLRAAGGMA